MNKRCFILEHNDENVHYIAFKLVVKAKTAFFQLNIFQVLLKNFMIIKCILICLKKNEKVNILSILKIWSILYRDCN